MCYELVYPKGSFLMEVWKLVSKNKQEYLISFSKPLFLPELIEIIANKYGGGVYQFKIDDKLRKETKLKTFEIAGEPIKF